jgi:hypothetical protein
MDGERFAAGIVIPTLELSLFDREDGRRASCRARVVIARTFRLPRVSVDITSGKELEGIS